MKATMYPRRRGSSDVRNGEGVVGEKKKKRKTKLTCVTGAGTPTRRLGGTEK